MPVTSGNLSTGSDTIFSGESISGNQTIISKGGVFELGFFTPDSSSIMWQSFDHPTDTWLPGAKFGYNKVTNDSQILTSWRSCENPTPGLFSAELEPKGELVNLQQFSSENKIGREIHVHVAASELLGSKAKTDGKTIWIVVGAIATIFLLYVYDYMPKGSLESHLFREGSQILDWKVRYNIALGTARGLAYLHEECRDCIIHCDIKPENILLDADYNPKVADFGLAKLVGRDFSRVFTTMRGTRGYLTPEWLSSEAITPKVDVFSFGKLLFEIISDYKLENSDSIEELTRACKVACWCIQDDEKDRPTMGQAVQILEGIMEVGMPPIPQILQRLAEDPVISNFYQETETSTSSY
uniref:Protein kinase domain-containing protein n=1 Tax=Quercus lobata TaxID=97700 RepID=A0A7N2MC20_QUELO